MEGNHLEMRVDSPDAGLATGWARDPGRLLSRLALSRSRLAVGLAVLAALALAAVAGIWLFGAGSATRYIAVRVSRGAVSRTVTATGSINPMLTITVGSYISGVIQEIHCDFNTKVKKGQLCAKIDPRPYQSIVDQDRASVATAQAQLLKDKANLAYAQIDEKRLSGLVAQNATSRSSYDVAVNTLSQARAQVAIDRATIDQRKSALEAALVNLSYTNIVSPVDGIVVSRNVTMGQTVAASFQTPTLFLIASDLSKMQIDTNVSESDVGRVRTGDKAHFTVEAFPDSTFDGVVMQVRQAPQTVQNVVTYDIVVAAANPELLLKPGMTATVRVITAQHDNVLRVPNQALRYVPGGLSASSGEAGAPPGQVWVLRDRRPYRVAVATGLDDDSYTEIKSGELQEGDRVILSERERSTARPARSRPAMRFR